MASSLFKTLTNPVRSISASLPRFYSWGRRASNGPSQGRMRNNYSGRLRGTTLQVDHLSFSKNALQSLQPPAWHTSTQTEAGPKVMTRNAAVGKVLLSTIPDKPVKRRPKGTPRGRKKHVAAKIQVKARFVMIGKDVKPDN